MLLPLECKTQLHRVRDKNFCSLFSFRDKKAVLCLKKYILLKGRAGNMAVIWV